MISSFAQELQKKGAFSELLYYKPAPQTHFRIIEAIKKIINYSGSERKTMFSKS